MTKLLRSCLITSLFVCLALSLAQSQQAKETMPVKPEDRFAKFDTMRVHYQNYGKGKDALVFVHGWTCNLTFWKANVPAFVDQTRVIAIDLPGHGVSDKPQVAYSMDLFANAVDAVLRDAGVERATLVGHSMGTPVIRQFYRKYPAKTRGLVIVDGSLQPFPNPEQMRQFLDTFRGPNYKQVAEGVVNSMVAPMKDKAAAAEVKTAMLSAPQHVLVSAFEGMLDESIWKVQDKINVPTLVIMNKQPNRTPEYERFVRDLAPGVDYQVWEGVSHFLMMDDPQKFNDTVLAFLKKNGLTK
jgi:pimeloyl-ACP methyl ester carboxylesterase